MNILILIFPLILAISALIGNAQSKSQLFPNEWRSLAKRNQNHQNHPHHRRHHLHHGQNAQGAHHMAVNRQKMSHFRNNYYSLLTKREREIVEKLETELLNGEMTWRDFEWMINNIDGLKEKLNGKIGGGKGNNSRQNGRAKWQEGKKSANYWAQMRGKQQKLRQRQHQWGGGGGGWQNGGGYGGYGGGGGNGGNWTPGMVGGPTVWRQKMAKMKKKGGRGMN